MSDTAGTPGLFDRWSRSYDRPTLQRSTYRPVHDAVLERIDATTIESILDLGCGTGWLTQRLAQSHPDSTVVGIDLSSGMLAAAAGHVGSNDGATGLVRADAGALPLAPASFDVAVCTESFHWYRHQQAVADDLFRVVRPGGQLVIVSIATITDLGDTLVRRASRFGGTTIRALPPFRLRQLLRRAGFRVVHQRRVPRFGPVAWPVLTDARRPLGDPTGRARP